MVIIYPVYCRCEGLKIFKSVSLVSKTYSLRDPERAQNVSNPEMRPASGANYARSSRFLLRINSHIQLFTPLTDVYKTHRTCLFHLQRTRTSPRAFTYYNNPSHSRWEGPLALIFFSWPRRSSDVWETQPTSIQ